MTPAELSRAVLGTVRRAVEAGELCAPVPTRVLVERPRRPGCGDYATNVALQLAGPAARPPRLIAEILRPRLAAEPGITGVEIAGPGFLNISLDGRSHRDLVHAVLQQGEAYGHGDAFARDTVELRFRPETRAAVTADSLARILRAQGAGVTTTCTGDPDPAWAALGVHVDGSALEDQPGQIPGRGPGQIPGPIPGQSPGRGPGQGCGPRTVVVRPVPAPPTVGDGSRTTATARFLERLGPDAARWALLRPAGHDHPHCTEDLLVQRESNPLFRVQYAHARACGLVRNATELGFGPGDEVSEHAGHPGHFAYQGLVDVIAEYPAVVESAARHRAPDRAARYVELLADTFFRFHDRCPVLPRGDEKPEAAHRARTALAQASGTVLAGGLHLLGITAPEFL